jgi:hypothetical protein
MFKVHVCVYACACVCVCVYLYVYMRAYMYVYMHAFIYMYTFLLRNPMRLPEYVRVSYMYIHMYTQYLHICIQTNLLDSYNLVIKPSAPQNFRYAHAV